MKWNLGLACYRLSLGFLLTVAGAASAAEREWQYPVIREYGKVLPLPDSALQPDRKREARIDIKLIEALKRSGVIVYVCGQALAHNGFAQSWVNQDVTVALSAMMVLAHYQSEGYALVE